jgi:hypothetical protein
MIRFRFNRFATYRRTTTSHHSERNPAQRTLPASNTVGVDPPRLELKAGAHTSGLRRGRHELDQAFDKPTSRKLVSHYISLPSLSPRDSPNLLNW